MAKQNKEQILQGEIQAELSKHDIITFRINVIGLYSKDGRFIPPSVPKGHSDLYCVLKGGKIAYIEVKKGKGKPSKEQINFLEVMKKQGALGGLAYSIEDALKICEVI